MVQVNGNVPVYPSALQLVNNGVTNCIHHFNFCIFRELALMIPNIRVLGNWECYGNWWLSNGSFTNDPKHCYFNVNFYTLFSFSWLYVIFWGKLQDSTWFFMTNHMVYSSLEINLINFHCIQVLISILDDIICKR